MDGLELIEDFLNTVDERTFRRHGESHVGGEHLTSPQALADWLAAHGLETGVGRDAGGAGSLQAADLSAAVALRTALRETLSTSAGAQGAADASAALSDYPLRLVPDPSGALRLAADCGRPWLDVLVETVASSAARGDWRRIKLCAAVDCRWAFHDTSRSGRGRWCSMETCGNRHKTRTYRERRRQASTP